MHSAQKRLDADPDLQRAVEHLHGLGPRPFGSFLATLLDDLGAPDALNRLLEWRELDPAVVTAVGAAHWPRPPLRPAPSAEPEA